MLKNESKMNSINTYIICIIELLDSYYTSVDENSDFRIRLSIIEKVTVIIRNIPEKYDNAKIKYYFDLYMSDNSNDMFYRFVQYNILLRDDISDEVFNFFTNIVLSS
jgi:hypothetical protein